MNIFYDVPNELSKLKTNEQRFNYIYTYLKKTNRVKKQKIKDTEELYGDKNILVHRKENNTILLCAHYDAFVLDDDQTGPAANDNGSGVSMLIKLITEHPEFKIDYAFFGSEEIGCLGSDEYIQQLDKEHKFVINIDSCGYCDKHGILIPEMIYQKNTDIILNEKLINICKDKKYKYCTIDDSAMGDHINFILNNIPTTTIQGEHCEFFGLNENFEYSDDEPIMHTERDTVDKLDMNFMTNIYDVLVEFLNNNK